MSRVPPSASGSTAGAENELATLEELSDDAIVAHQQGAHAPQPRAQVTEETRSIVIAEQSRPVGDPPLSRERRSRRRSERTEKTVVIRSRRQLEDLRRAMAQQQPRAKAAERGWLLWVLVGLAAFATGGLVALFATPTKHPAQSAAPAAAPTEASPAAAAATTSAEPPSVSIDELPIEGQANKKR